ncbi:hypothetical protein HYPSUDRAFT_56408 [Hypholoma sublateritium FD-334 SS-4]|uniref:Uncharacterized protein n=1 Tax=Hypholoma sublateritium (strain FD-334 SS-4) TaxID=945553 RepID=A0A0D2NLR2_HYPSF|nr:hypothetical protein HYPSUDRAFT_56408 [Hypholoma sublateritium FD-334 SS-4]
MSSQLISSSADATDIIVIDLEDLSTNLNNFPVADDCTGRGHFLPALHECIDLVKNSLEGNPATITAFKRMFAKSGEVLAPQHQDVPDCEWRSFYGPLYDTTRESKYKPHLFDGQGRPREPTPPPPALPEYIDDQISVEYPTGKIEWMDVKSGDARLEQMVAARETALKLGSTIWRPILPPPEPKPTLVVDTPEGRWLMPPRSGGEYRERVGAWAQETNARRERDGIAERVDGEFDAQAVEQARLEELERKQKESEERNREFTETVDPDEDRQAWKEAMGFIPSKKRRISPTQSTSRALTPTQDLPSPPLSTDMPALRSNAVTSSVEGSSTSSPQPPVTTEVEVKDETQPPEFQSTLKRKLRSLDTKEEPSEATVPLSTEDRAIKPLPRHLRGETAGVKIEDTPEPAGSPSRKRAREETKEEEDAVLTPSKKARSIKPIPSSKAARSASPTGVPISSLEPAPRLIPLESKSATSTSLPSTPQRTRKSVRASASPNEKEPTRRSARIRDSAKKATPTK